MMCMALWLPWTIWVHGLLSLRWRMLGCLWSIDIFSNDCLGNELGYKIPHPQKFMYAKRWVMEDGAFMWEIKRTPWELPTWEQKKFKYIPIYLCIMEKMQKSNRFYYLWGKLLNLWLFFLCPSPKRKWSIILSTLQSSSSIVVKVDCSIISCM